MLGFWCNLLINIGKPLASTNTSLYQFGSGFKQDIYNKAYQGQTVNAEGLIWMAWMATLPSLEGN